MWLETLWGISIPFIGTLIGAFFILFARRELFSKVEGPINGFVSGIMLAASVWSLLIPAMDLACRLEVFAFLPAVVGLLLGMVFMILMEEASNRFMKENKRQSLSARNRRIFLAVTLHNIPEGMAVGAIFAGLLSGERGVSLTGAMMLALGIALQNIPEGTIISMPLCAGGMKKSKAAMYGLVSGLVEPLSALLTIWATELIVPILPYLLSFAAGSMMYVVASELIPEMHEGKGKKKALLWLGFGFSLMMSLDVALG